MHAHLYFSRLPRAARAQLLQQYCAMRCAQAIVFLHPEGPAAAAAEEAAEAGAAMRAATAAATATARAAVRLGAAPAPGAAATAAARQPPAPIALAGASAMPPPPPSVSTPRTPASALRPTLSGLAVASRAGSLPGTPTGTPAADAEDFQVWYLPPNVSRHGFATLCVDTALCAELCVRHASGVTANPSVPSTMAEAYPVFGAVRHAQRPG